MAFTQSQSNYMQASQLQCSGSVFKSSTPYWVMASPSHQALSLGTYKCQVNNEKASNSSSSCRAFSSCVVSMENELFTEKLSIVSQRVNPHTSWKWAHPTRIPGPACWGQVAETIRNYMKLSPRIKQFSKWNQVILSDLQNWMNTNFK
jgi:hypothetical protein